MSCLTHAAEIIWNKLHTVITPKNHYLQLDCLPKLPHFLLCCNRWKDDHEWWVGNDLEWDSMGYFEISSWHSCGQTTENHNNSQSGWPVTWLRFKLGTSYIQVWSVTAIQTCLVKWQLWISLKEWRRKESWSVLK